MTIRQFFRIVEMRTKAVSVSTFFLALLYSLWRFGTIHGFEATLCFAAVLFVDMGTTAFNTYYDFRRGVDSPDTNRENDKVLVHQNVSPSAALFVALCCFALAGTLGLVLTALSGFWVLVLGGASLAAGFFYSGGPKPLSRTPFGELFAGAFLGTVLFVIVGRLVSGRFDGLLLAASVPGFAIIASILAANNLCDIKGDTAAGRRTLPIVLGKKFGIAALYVGGLAAFGLPAIFSVLGVYPAWSALGAGVAAAIALPEYGKMDRRGFTHETKGPTMGGILKIFILWSFGMAGGFAAGILLA